MKRLSSSVLKRICAGILALLLFFLLGLPAFAQATPQMPIQVVPATPPTGLTDSKELEAFLDRFFAEYMPAEHIPGAVFVLVKDGKIFFSKGYGYADLEKQIPVIPEKTVFRVGSISKLFTTTAVMQLAERGKLNLNNDVNNYLDRFQLEDNYPQPVTVANLLTHTGGIDENFIGIAARSQAEIAPLGDYLAKHPPYRALPPGEVLRYSNLGFALAGYLVEAVSHVPFVQYIDQNILQPLGMRHSSFQLLPQLVADMAVGYRYKQGSYQPLPIVYTNDMPSGALSATATDIARFAIAHLQNGRFGNTRILQEATAQEMQHQHFTHHPQLSGQAYGFSERFQNELRAIEHEGHLAGFKSRLLLLPDQKVGFFSASNNDKSKLHDELIRQFLDRYYPVLENPNLKIDAGTRGHRDADTDSFSSFVVNASSSASNRFTGTYRYVRYPRQSIDKLAALLPGTSLFSSKLQVTVNGDGTLALGDNHFAEMEPMLFQQVSGSSVTFRGNTFLRAAFRENVRGRITYLFLGKYAFEKLAWYENTTFQLSLLGICVLVFLSGWIICSAKYLKNPWHRQLSRLSGIFVGKIRRSVYWIRLLAHLICTLNLVFLISFIGVLALSDLSEFAYGMPLVMIVLLCIPLLTAGLAIGLPLLIILAWKSKHWSGVSRLYYLAIALAELGFIWFLDYWNVLGFRF